MDRKATRRKNSNGGHVARGVDGLTFGERLRVLRERAGLTQQEVSANVGLSERAGNVTAWEKDEAMPKGETMLALRELFDVDGHYLMTGDASKGAPTPPVGAVRQLLEWMDRVLPPKDGGDSDESG